MVDAHEFGLDLGMRDLMHHKQVFDEVLRRVDVSAVNGYVVEFDRAPGLVVSGIVIPECDV